MARRTAATEKLAAVYKANDKTPGWLIEVWRANGDVRRLVGRLLWRAIVMLDALEDRDMGVFDLLAAVRAWIFRRSKRQPQKTAGSAELRVASRTRDHRGDAE
jgi:hypothetical protein